MKARTLLRYFINSLPLLALKYLIMLMETRLSIKASINACSAHDAKYAHRLQGQGFQYSRFLLSSEHWKPSQPDNRAAKGD